MSDQTIDGILKRIEDYGSEAEFAKIVADALALQPQAELAAFKKKLGALCGRVPPSTIDRWARAASIPGENVRRHVLGRIRDLLTDGRP